MWKYIIMAIGTLAIVVGGIDWLVGALVPHSRLLLGTGAAMLVVAVILYLVEQWRQLHTWPMLVLAAVFFSAVDAYAGPHDVLIPPDHWPMLQWNPSTVSGSEVWLWVLGLVALFLVYTLISYFLRDCFPQSQK